MSSYVFSRCSTVHLKSRRISDVYPFLHADTEGKHVSAETIRSKYKSGKAIVRKIKRFAESGTVYSDNLYISHTRCPKNAALVAEEIEAAAPKLIDRVETNNIGTVIGSLFGLRTAEIFFRGITR